MKNWLVGSAIVIWTALLIFSWVDDNHPSCPTIGGAMKLYCSASLNNQPE